MARNETDLPSGPNASWTDMIPPNRRPSSSHRIARTCYGRRIPQATPHMVTRMQTIRSKLAYIKTTIDKRLYLQQLVQNNGSYCPHCTPLGVTGHCDPTCSLLRPTDKEYPSYWCEYDDPWLGRIETDLAAYQNIVNDMEARGTQVYAATVGRWERGMTKLMEECLVTTETEERDGWPEAKNTDYYDEQVVENLAPWRFETALGKGPGLEVGIAPEVVGVKRKLPEDRGNEMDWE
ncbi:hypothetical protein PTMSG1_09946 [Pyrenophora teres f. maculata]|nr:hypothetical protein PTMSG1_09946 [Pyrenophora teres f. maculata]